MDNNIKMPLKSGAHIAIVGGGPSGCFFANFANDLARQLKMDVSVTIFEWRNFAGHDKRGCNMSVGVLSENLLQKLDGVGISIPERCIQTEIKEYHFITREDRISLHHPIPGHKPRIVTVFRGAGPAHSHFEHDVSLDNFMLTTAEGRGARVIHEEVKEVVLPKRPEDKVVVVYGHDAKELHADLVVGAFGINTPTAEIFEKMYFGYIPPRTIRACIIETPLDRDFLARKNDSNTIHVFALGMKDIEFASLTPRGDYLTVAIVGKRDISTPQVKQFLNHPAVLKILPGGEDVLKNCCCVCFPKISVSTPAQPYTDRLVVIGDAGISRSYKNGIESAFIVAQMAANTVFRQGVSKEAFRRGYYEPARSVFARDNLYAKIMFKLFDLFASREHQLSDRMGYTKIHKEGWVNQQINEGLWKLVTGDAPYRDIFMELFSPRLQFALLPVTLGGVGEYLKERLGLKTNG
ncbi:MAG TPA: NAD(P)/FAD-dependent oxidoreductase [Candidatus Avalokitesvara rifleensis]|uniref:NAD(P)/FAD-dependent oxidoreductase n=1 Tax=Candidatus Avalokitesvara rifleensis TaxID=3367620 RepID=UPI004028D325